MLHNLNGHGIVIKRPSAVVASSRLARANGSSSSVGPASSAATSPTRCSADERTTKVTLYDNFSSGQEWHYADHADDPRLEVVRADANDLPALCEAMAATIW